MPLHETGFKYMLKTINDRLKDTTVRLTYFGFADYAEMLSDAYSYGVTSSEIYFTVSGILKAVLNTCDIKDDGLIKSIQMLKVDIDKQIS